MTGCPDSLHALDHRISSSNLRRSPSPKLRPRVRSLASNHRSNSPLMGRKPLSSTPAERPIPTGQELKVIPCPPQYTSTNAVVLSPKEWHSNLRYVLLEGKYPLTVL